MQGLSIDSQSNITIKHEHDLIASRIERLLFTGVGESIGNLERGSLIPEFFWEGATLQNAQAILREVKLLITSFEPTIRLVNVGVKFVTPNSENGKGWSNTALLIIIEYALRNNPNDVQSITLSKIKD